jgi:hypothetical protein
MSNWTLLSNHGHVLVCLSRDPEARLRDVAADVGITERAVQKIVRDLQEGSMIGVTKSGRRNSYRVHMKQTLRHQLETDCTLKDLIGVINRSQKSISPDARPAAKEEAKAASTIDAGNENTGPKPSPGKPEPAKPTAAKSKGAKESKTSESLEKQQGTLF